MRRLLAIALLAMPGSVGAISSHQNWIFGTRPYETVPAFEADLEYNAHYIEGPSPVAGWRHGLAVELGILDDWMASGLARVDASGRFLPEVSSRLRFGEAGQFPVDLALAGRWERVEDHDIFSGGPVLALELWDHSLALNAFGHSDEDFEFRAAWRSAYLAWFLQVGLEGQYLLKSNRGGLGPQLFFNFIGDLSLSLGAWIPSGRPEDWQARLTLDFTLFQNP